jgi:hypothetical protein
MSKYVINNLLTKRYKDCCDGCLIIFDRTKVDVKNRMLAAKEKSDKNISSIKLAKLYKQAADEYFALIILMDSLLLVSTHATSSAIEAGKLANSVLSQDEDIADVILDKDKKSYN